MAITTEQIKELRDATSVSIMQCKKALEEADGDMEKAKVILRKQSAKAADKKADRELGSGIVESYIHAGGSIGSMVELLCETDFVAKNEEFTSLAKEIAMQVAATAPEYIRESDITEEAKNAASAIFTEEAKDKPEDIREKIVQGKMDAYFADKVLLKQAHIKNPDQTIEDMIKSAIQKLGERVEIGRVARFSING